MHACTNFDSARYQKKAVRREHMHTQRGGGGGGDADGELGFAPTPRSCDLCRAVDKNVPQGIKRLAPGYIAIDIRKC